MGQRLTDKSALNNHTGTGDLYMVVDVSDTTGSAAGTSKKLDSKFVLQTDKISLSNAEILALGSTSKTLVSAPGSGYAIVPICAMLMCTYAAPGNSSKASMSIAHADAANEASLNSNPMGDSATTDNVYRFESVGGGVFTRTSSIDNVPLILHSSSAAFNGGFSADLYITYQIIKLS